MTSGKQSRRQRRQTGRRPAIVAARVDADVEQAAVADDMSWLAPQELPWLDHPDDAGEADRRSGGVVQKVPHNVG